MTRTIKTQVARTANAMKRLYRCEKGAEGLEKLLIIGAIVIPLLGLLIAFRRELAEWAGDMWSDVQDDSENSYDTSDF